ncbi:hypothetical protein AQUCO_02000586v1, partial [Aquilegia coerulea]
MSDILQIATTTSTSYSWSQLPEELLMLVAERIDYIEDFIRFGAVSKSWRSLTLVNKHHFSSIFKTKTLPWLLMLTAYSHQGTTFREFFSLAQNKTYRFNLPQAYGTKCWGSPFGWLITLASSGGNFQLLNPLCPHSCIPLPPLTALPRQGDHLYENGYIWKAALFLSHSNIHFGRHCYPNRNYDHERHFLVFVIHGYYQMLAFARPGDTSWTTIKFPDEYLSQRQVDILHLNGQFYSVNSNGCIWLLSDIFGPDLTLTRLAILPPDNGRLYETFSLIEMQGEILMAARVLHILEVEDLEPMEFQAVPKTSSIQVYKLDRGTFSWEKMETLGDYTLFVGSGTSISVKASDYSGSDCNPGCIYFSYDDCLITGMITHDVGIFNLINQEIEPFNV